MWLPGPRVLDLVRNASGDSLITESRVFVRGLLCICYYFYSSQPYVVCRRSMSWLGQHYIASGFIITLPMSLYGLLFGCSSVCTNVCAGHEIVHVNPRESPIPCNHLHEKGGNGLFTVGRIYGSNQCKVHWSQKNQCRTQWFHAHWFSVLADNQCTSKTTYTYTLIIIVCQKWYTDYQ